MKNRKVPGWLLSLILILGVALPCMFAAAKDMEETGNVFSGDTAEEAKQDQETPVGEAEQNQEMPVEETGQDQETPVEETEQDQETLPEEAEQNQETPVEDIAHNDGVSETDKPALYARIMACISLEEIGIVLREAADEEFASLTDEENMEISAFIESFEQAPLPPVVITKSDDEPVASEIIYLTVSFTKVAPFGTPVTGGAN